MVASCGEPLDKLDGELLDVPRLLHAEHPLSTTTHRAFGIEQEHFIFDETGATPTPEAIENLWSILIQEGFQVRGVSPEGTVLSIERMTDDGPLVITNDSCTHIIEAAFPKMNCLQRFRELYEATWDQLRDKLQLLGLAIQLGGSLREAPSEIHWRQKESDPKGERLKKFLTRNAIDHPLFCQAFPACFAATHVSLEMPAQEAIAKLPYFYSREYLVPLEFSTSKEFQGVHAHCIRPLAWLANFHQPYPLLGIPESIPTTLEEYQQMQTQCSGRDYSFVAIRDANRLEFRSACSQNSIDDVERLLRFRLESDVLANNANAKVIADSSRRAAYEDFKNACATDESIPGVI